jgi:hypothetical protein
MGHFVSDRGIVSSVGGSSLGRSSVGGASLRGSIRYHAIGPQRTMCVSAGHSRVPDWFNPLRQHHDPKQRPPDVDTSVRRRQPRALCAQCRVSKPLPQHANLANTPRGIDRMARSCRHRSSWLLPISQRPDSRRPCLNCPLRRPGIRRFGSLRHSSHLCSLLDDERNHRRRSPRRIGATGCNRVDSMPREPAANRRSVNSPA